METRSNKRRRLITISSYVSSWPNVPATFESLNDDTLTTVLKFIGNKSYRTFGGLNKHCKEIYLATKGMTKETFLYGYGPLAVIKDRIERAIEDNDWDFKLEAVGKGVVLYNRRYVLEWGLEAQNMYVLKGICNVAAKEGRIDTLVEVWNNLNDEDDDEYIFRVVDYYAARGGKLNALKWLETKGLPIDGYECVHEAARYGHLHIIQWLKEEKGVLLSAGMYIDAIFDGGNHLCVMKWLREQKVDWSDFTFRHAAHEGNLEVLQWLHDEGCPWPGHFPVREKDLKPEVIEWCRSNGYSDRISLRN